MATEVRAMTMPEEFVLLLIDDDTGFTAAIPEWRMSCALIGAVLLDLSFRDRIDTGLRTLKVIDPTPTGDELLDPTLAMLVAETGSHSPRYWVERLAPQADDINEVVFDRLVQRDIVEHDNAGFSSLSSKVARSGCPIVNGAPGEQILDRVMRTLFDDETPDPQDAMVIGLVRACRGFDALLTPEQCEEAEDRIKLITGMDLFGRAVLAAVENSDSPPASMRVPGAQRLPTVGLLDCLKSPSFRAKNLPKFFAEQAVRVGPAFTLKLPGKSRVVLAGTEMNHWMGRKGRLFLRTRDYLEGFQTAWGTGRSIASMDGAEHYRMRKAARAGNSRAVVEARLEELITLGRDEFERWEAGGVLPGETTCQRWIGRQIARLSTSIDPPIEILDGLLEFQSRALLVYIVRVLPQIALRTPAMRRAHAAVLALYARIHARHSSEQRQNRRRDLVDDLVDLHSADPQFLPETDLEFAFIAPLIAGQYVGSAMSFALYELMSNPDLYERIAAEADALFANGDPAAADLQMQAIDVTHRFVMENLRLHPVIPVQFRTAANAFEVDGKLVPARSNILVVYPAAHYMAENFQEPDKFDIDRYLPSRNEHRKRGAYHPFGVGTHTCLGQRFTELMMVADLLLVAHHLELEMVPADYKLKLSPLPKFSPNKRFKFRIKRIRNPIAPPS